MSKRLLPVVVLSGEMEMLPGLYTTQFDKNLVEGH